MKVSLQRNQILLLMGGLVVFLGTVALAWIGIGSLLEKNESAKGLLERKEKKEIAESLGRPGGIEDLRKEITQIDLDYRELLQKQEELLGPWRHATLMAEGNGQEWSKDVNKWKDMLVSYNDEIAKRAGKSGEKKKVTLASDFYLGLNEFKQMSPSEEKIPDLAIQLFISKRLVDLLFEAKEKTSEGYPTPCILQRLQGPSGQTTQKPLEGKPKTVEKSYWARHRYAVDLECSPEVLFSYMNALVKDECLFIPVDLSLENEKTDFPKRSEVAGLFEQPKSEIANSEPIRGVSTNSAPPLLLVLAGKEKVKISLQIDFVVCHVPVGQKPSTKGSNP